MDRALLFVLVAVAAVFLIIIMSTPPPGIVCISSDPAKILVKSSSVSTGDSASEIVLQNLTGGEITGFAANARADGEYFAADGLKINGEGPGSAGLDFSAGDEIAVTPDFGPRAGSGARFYGQYEFDYSDYIGLQRTVTIACHAL